MCGNNNCLETRSPFAFYDEEDDCCERACKPNHPCQEGEGHCESDSDCDGALVRCGDNNCKDSNYFPQERFFWNYLADIYSDTDNCCYKICRPEAKCDVNVYGCQHDNDCLEGLYCDSNDNYCRDINECDKLNGRDPGYIYCGRYTDCVNNDRSFTCNCQPGFKDFEAYEGCIDIDECVDNSHNCDLIKESCYNTIGSFVCVCKDGFTGVVGSCNDVDECSMGTHSCSPKSVLHAETSYIDDQQVFEYDYIQLSSGSHDLVFEVAGSGTCQISIGSGDIFYKIEIDENSKATIYKVVNGQENNLKSKELSAASTLQATNYVHYFANFNPDGSSMVISLGEGDSLQIFATDSSFSSVPVEVDTIAVQTLTKETYWRNIKLGVVDATECFNSVGSFICQPISLTSLAIGFGGHTRSSSSEYSHEFQVITDKLTVCGSHNIPKLSKSLYRGGIAEIDGWLYVCGGKLYQDTYPTSACSKYNLNTIGGNWVSAPSLPKTIYIHTLMVSFENSIYVIGGHYYGPAVTAEGLPTTEYYSLNTNYEFNHGTNYWTAKTSYPYAITDSGIVVDENDRKIWIIGGHELHVGKRRQVYYYLVDNNNWHHHSDLPYDVMENTCQILYSQNDNKKIICVLGEQSNAIWYYDLSSNTGWHHMGYLRHSYYQKMMTMLSLDKYKAILVGGYSQLNAVSSRNFWVWDQYYNKFYDQYYYLQNAAKGGFWTTVQKSKNYRALQNCVSETRTYAAVGWGGNIDVSSEVYPTDWNVFLRKRREGYSGKPTTCHGIIPDLIPGRKFAMITAVGYKLLVCGGGSPDPTDKCFKFETNMPNQTWNEIDSIDKPTSNGLMLSYADAAYLSGGYFAEINQITARTLRWTEKDGWSSTADMPTTLEHHCGVTDERYGNLFIGGGGGGNINISSS